MEVDNMLDDPYGDVPEEIDGVVGKMLESLRHKDTVVRWAAAKALARVTERLPKEYVNGQGGVSMGRGKAVRVCEGELRCEYGKSKEG